MTFDAIALHAAKDELVAAASGGRVDNVVLVGPLTLGLHIYARGRKSYVVASAEPTVARVCLVPGPPRRASDRVTPFLLLLRKYVRDGRIVHIRQPRLERLLELRIASYLDGRPHEVSLIIEVMGRRSNVVLVDEDGAILDALRRAGPDHNPGRPILPHLRYQPPPAQDRLDPLDPLTWLLLRDMAMASPPAPALSELLAAKLAGLSPQLAREVAFRATGSVGTPADRCDWSAVRQTVDELLAPIDGRGTWSPCVVRDEEGQVVAFAPYWLSHLDQFNITPMPSISAAIVEAYGQPLPRSVGDAAALAAPLLAQLDEERRRLERRIAALERSMELAARAEELRLSGEAVLASLASIREGQTDLEFDGRPVALDPSLSPLENAQRYFAEYRRARDAAQKVPALTAQAQADLQYVLQARTLLELAETPARVKEIRCELEEAGFLRAKVQPRRTARSSGGRGSLPSPMKFTTSDGLPVLVGTSGRGNEVVTFRLAGPEDVWLHARGFPGAHVILKTGGRPAPHSSLVEAAQLAARYSAARQDGRVPVDWTLRKHVRKAKGGRPGLVLYTGEETILVEPSQSPAVGQDWDSAV